MLWRRKKRLNLEIDPEEIFLDASNVSDFDHARFEGRIEKPLSSGTFLSLSILLGVLFLGLFIRSWSLEVTNGKSFAEQSAHNSLEVVTLFAPRGVITDVHGAVLAQNVENPDGTVTRDYPEQSLSQIIGYVSYPKKDSHGVYYDTSETGLTGIEAQYDALLAGKNGQLLTETDALGKVHSQGTIVPAESGKTIQMSVDADMNKALARAIAHVASMYHFIAGAGVILDVHTGAVRAIVSYPTFDPQVITSGGPAATIASYNSNPGHPFLDHAVQGVYAPGSIVKPFVASGALADGIITPTTVIDDPGVLYVNDPYHEGEKFKYTGWKALGSVDVKKAIAWSSDIFFYSVGGGTPTQKGLGIDRLDYWYTQFGFGTTTGIDLLHEAAGVVPTPAWKKETFNEPWYLGDTYFTAIGQYSMQVTPMQAVRATAAVANGGKLFTPTLLVGQTPSYTKIPVDDSILATVRAGMRQGVTSALAQALNLPYVSVAAKTGTAQTGNKNQYDNSWVEGFFPYDNPQYAFAVVLERGPAGAGEQSVNVMREFFDILYSQNSPYVGGTATSSVAL